jgi:hypothetical protein
MDFYGSESYGGKTYAEWVSEWIEEGNKFLVGGHVYTKAEDEIKKDNLAEKELVKAFKNIGVKAETY